MLPDPPKQRHGCLIIYLIVFILTTLVSMFIVFVILVAPDAAYIHRRYPAAGFFLWTSMIGLLGLLVSTVAMFWLKRWAFYSFCFFNIVLGVLEVVAILTINSGAEGFSSAFSSLISAGVSILLLWGALQMGNESRGWDQLD